MSATEGVLHLVVDSKEFLGRWELQGEFLHLDIAGMRYSIDSEGDLARRLEPFLKQLGKKVFRQSIQLKACLTCRHFFMSSMARDMGRGQRGGCSLHGMGVEVCFWCPDFDPHAEPENSGNEGH